MIKGWHGGATIGIFGGITAAAKILNFDEEEVKMAIGYAASSASGIAANFGSMTKPLHLGAAARNAVIGANLVKKGFNANKNVLEAPLGFYDLYRGNTEPDLKRFNFFGKPYGMTTLVIKLYPCCNGIHPTLGNVFALTKEHQISPEDVDSIEIYTHSGEIRAHLTKEYVDGGSVIHGYTGPRRQIVPSNPTTGAEGKFSLEYCVARALLDKEITFAKFTDEKVREPEVRELMKKVKILHDERMERLLEEGQRSGDGKMTGGLEIRLKDGREFYQEEDFPVGSFQHWPSKKVFEDKVRDCAAYGGFSQEIAEQVIRITENLEKLDDITELTEVLGRREK
jgi:2-methylcitrate dehydratase PrpD